MMVILLIVVSTGIIVSLGEGSSKASEEISSNLYSKNAEHLGNYALQWGIKQVKNGAVTSDTVQNFTNFDALNYGSIQRVEWDFGYIYNSNSNAINIIADIEWSEGGKTFPHQSSVIIIPPTTTSGEVPNAIEVGGNLTIKGSAEVNGTTEDGADVDFEEIFGMTKDEMKAIATHIYDGPVNKPSPVESITWIEGDAHFSSNVTEMSGLLIITGTCHWAGADFDGILYVMGGLELDPSMITGNSIINGAILGECDITVTGNTEVNYDADIINDVFTNEIFTHIPPKIVAWSE